MMECSARSVASNQNETYGYSEAVQRDFPRSPPRSRTRAYFRTLKVNKSAKYFRRGRLHTAKQFKLGLR